MIHDAVMSLINYSNVVDVFTVLPRSNEGIFSCVVFICFAILTDAANPNKQNVLPQPQHDETIESDTADEEMAYKNIKRGRVGRIASPLKKDERGWSATKAVMG